ncbi:hypothetical protein LARV_03120 [Longilinea arvoryzae]|uniref:Uncharacterized protein n=1 Tax=Longilinea arvoryzae TaxID=360412 RepID=A0A0S7BM09_9CHLR|nr:hypothetical protein [Longilinea arvoryzae]GAP15336.1 hypothetical protein LARV_03120 [Longilinea arvoryzae]
MNPKLNQTNLMGYTRDAVLILQQVLQHYHEGQEYFYRVAAVELRLLLCDTVRRHDRVVSLALVKRLWPDVRFQPIDAQSKDSSLPLEDWLEQKLPDGDLTLRQFIRQVCDQDGGAHVDIRQHARMPGRHSTAAWICKLSEITLAALVPLLSGDNRKP